MSDLTQFEVRLLEFGTFQRVYNWGRLGVLGSQKALARHLVSFLRIYAHSEVPSESFYHFAIE